MRRVIALFLVVLLVTAGSGSVRADETGAGAAASDTPRNPIEWILSDVGKLLKSATEKLAKTAATKKSPDTPAPEKNATPASVEGTTDTAKATAGDPEAPAPTAQARAAETPAEPETKTAFRNPISWFFKDLARLFQPDLQIDNGTETAEQPREAVPDETIAETQLPEPAQSDTASADTVAPAGDQAEQPDMATDTADAGARNPINWLLNDLVSLFTAKPAEQEQLAQKAAETEAETAALPASTPMPAAGAEPATVDETVAADQAPPSDPEPHAVETAEAQPTAEITPWIMRTKGDPFDPEASLFNSDGTPVLALAPTPAPAVADEADSAAVAETRAPIRKRQPAQPAVRNYASLGRDQADTSEPVDGTLLDRVLENLFGLDTPIEAEETLANKVSDRIVPEEKLDLGYTSPDADFANRELTEIGDGPITQLDLFMGRGSVVGAAYDATAHNANACVERPLHGSVFCLENMEWPAEIASTFATDTAFVLPGEGVVRYENGAVSRVYAVFKASGFADVVKFMQKRFGPPQQREINWMHMLEAPKLPNTTFRWQAFTPDRKDAIVLEVRNYDDLRRSFADMDHGMVRLYRMGSRPIFKHISTMDLMLMQRRRLARAPVEVNQPPKQN